MQTSVHVIHRQDVGPGGARLPQPCVSRRPTRKTGLGERQDRVWHLGAAEVQHPYRSVLFPQPLLEQFVQQLLLLILEFVTQATKRLG